MTQVIRRSGATVIVLSDVEAEQMQKLLTDWQIDSYFRGTENHEDVDVVMSYEKTRVVLHDLLTSFGIHFEESQIA